jgi:HEAT repeat protein
LPLLKSENAVIRAASVSALSECAARHSLLTRTGNGGILSLLSDMLADADSSVRIAAAVGMQRAATAIAQSQLDQDLKTQDSEIQLLATRSYRAPELRPGKQAIWHLTSQVTRSKDFRLRRQSAATLLTCGQATADGVLETLQKALADPEDPCRDQYLMAAQRGGYWSVSLLPGIAQYIRPGDRHCKLAIETVATIGMATDEVVDRLIVCLKTAKDDDVRCAAADALGELAPPKTEVITALIEALDGWFVGDNACQALGKLRNVAASAVPHIEAAVHLGYRVPEALARIRTPDAIAALWRLYNIGYGGYGDHVGRTDQQDLFDRADAELRNLGER